MKIYTNLEILSSVCRVPTGKARGTLPFGLVEVLKCGDPGRIREKSIVLDEGMERVSSCLEGL
jgi:hypothetical protein